ncbi:MAG: phosphate ABC transporter permease PstA [Verrucomicrobiia bacterium]
MKNKKRTPFQYRPSYARGMQSFCFNFLRGMTYAILIFTALIFADIFIKGSKALLISHFPYVNFNFLTQFPETLHVFQDPLTHQTRELGETAFRHYEAQLAQKGIVLSSEVHAYAGGGIFPCIVGTVLLVSGSMLIALVLGILSAIYLSEFGKQGRLIHWVRVAIGNLAGVPSIIYGLFGFSLFVIFLKWNFSLLAGCFTLAIMVLPIIITASEESLRAVPRGFREGSLALGATRWQTIRKSVLPYALSGILTSSILGIARVAGETAPIMFTAAYLVRSELPWEGLSKWSDFFFQGVQALPYHIYVLSTKVPQNEYTERVQYGTVFVFLLAIMFIALTSVVLRIKMRSRFRW